MQPELPAVQTEHPVEQISVQGTFSSIVMFLMRQNYIAALIVMMVSFFYTFLSSRAFRL